MSDKNFVCERCSFRTTTKLYLKRHLTRKTECEILNHNISREELLKKCFRKKNLCATVENHIITLRDCLDTKKLIIQIRYCDQVSQFM